MNQRTHGQADLAESCAGMMSEAGGFAGGRLAGWLAWRVVNAQNTKRYYNN